MLKKSVFCYRSFFAKPHINIYLLNERYYISRSYRSKKKLNGEEKMRSKKAKSKNAGFTMLELLIAILILGFGLLAVLLGNTYTQQASEKNYERMIAAQDASRVIESLRDASVNGNFPANVVAAYPNGVAVGGFNNLTNELISVNYTSTTSDPLDITVTTSWRERGRRNMSFQLKTLMTQRTNP